MPSAIDALCHHGQHDVLRYLLLMHYPIPVSIICYLFSPLPIRILMHYAITHSTMLRFRR